LLADYRPRHLWRRQIGPNKKAKRLLSRFAFLEGNKARRYCPCYGAGFGAGLQPLPLELLPILPELLFLQCIDEAALPELIELLACFFLLLCEPEPPETNSISCKLKILIFISLKNQNSFFSLSKYCDLEKKKCSHKCYKRKQSTLMGALTWVFLAVGV
jgi:hypothetical protein